MAASHRTRAEAIESARENSAVWEENLVSSHRYIVRTPGQRYVDMPYDGEPLRGESIVGIYRFDTGFESFTGK